MLNRRKIGQRVLSHINTKERFKKHLYDSKSNSIWAEEGRKNYEKARVLVEEYDEILQEDFEHRFDTYISRRPSKNFRTRTGIKSTKQFELFDSIAYYSCVKPNKKYVLIFKALANSGLIELKDNFYVLSKHGKAVHKSLALV